jgi:hypothetical protein
VLALKTTRYYEQLWTVTGITTTSTTTVVGGPTYSATIPACKTVNLFATDDAVTFITNPRFTIPALIKAKVVGGTATTLIPFTACAIAPAGTFVTICAERPEIICDCVCSKLCFKKTDIKNEMLPIIICYPIDC